MIGYAGGLVGLAKPAGGKSKLDPLLPKYLAASRLGMKWLIMRDLDDDAACAPDLIPSLVTGRHPCLCFRIAVKEVESWLLADVSAISKFLHVPPGAVPKEPERLSDPKAAIVSLAKRSNKTAVKEALVPSQKGGLRTGPEYSSWMIDFAINHWDIGQAIKHDSTPSLAKAAARLRELVKLPQP